jgi:hypothetical protein
MKRLYKPHMSKAEAIAEFKREVMPEVIKRHGRKDKSSMGEAWVNYIDNLERVGYISTRQAFNWDNPFYR